VLIEVPKQVPKRSWHPNFEPLSVIGIGCGRAGSISNRTPVHEIKRMLAQALDHGINVIDTANVYGGGDSERIIGEVVKTRPHKAFIVTKIGLEFSEGTKFTALVKPLLRLAVRKSSGLRRALLRERSRMISQNFEPSNLSAALEGSLRRLSSAPIGGLLLHDPPPEVLANDEVIGMLAKAKSDGKIRHFGASVDSPEALEAALKVDGLEILQLSMDLAAKLNSGAAAKRLADSPIAILVRQILRPSGSAVDQNPRLPCQAIPEALAIPNVTSAVIGLSSSKHLEAAIKAIS